ncbi:MAG: DUF3667 domain-containing protein, partial [Gammaproteobacteria bacterium]|nr:DUF3667 domain-containing protein [Gammaproteobacteria bacterium]
FHSLHEMCGLSYWLPSSLYKRTMKEVDSEILSEEVCPNCGNRLHGTFCFHCGQNQRNLNRFFWSLVSEAFEDIFSFNSRVSLTLLHLFFRPGFISDEYSKGRRARYVPPLRLYIITSVIFVLFLSLQNALRPQPSEIPIAINTEELATRTSAITDARPEMSDQQVITEIESSVSKMELTWLSDERADEIRNIARQQANKAYRIYKEDPSRFGDIMLDTLPPMMFILLPIFAVLLKLTYLFSGRYYTEHLVLALHNHCFLYLGFLFIQLFELITAPTYLVFTAKWILVIISTWMPIYLFLSLKNFYAQGLAMTILKFLFLSIAYVILLSIALTLAVGWGFFTL